MALKETIMSDLQDAMRSGDELKKTTLRMVRAEMQNAVIARANEILNAVDMNMLGVTGVSAEEFDEIKRRRRAAEEYEQNDELELAQQERTKIGSIVARLSAITDADIEQVIRRELKQRRESAEQYARANRQDLADKELAEAAILEHYLPQQLSEAEIEVEVRAVISELGASGPKGMSKVMPAAMSRLRGRADGRTVNQVVTRLLAE